MSIQNISSAAQNTELYKIRKQTEETKAENIQQVSVSSEQAQTDEYDKANPVGEEVEGIYSVSHDQEGNLKVDYKQPVLKSEAQSTSVNAKTDGAEKSGGVQAVSSTESESEDDEEEIEKLKQQRDAIKQQLNRETDEKVKSQLRAQLQSIEMQIALKSSQS